VQDLDEWWKGLHASMIHQAMLVVAQLLVGPPHAWQICGEKPKKQPTGPPGLLGVWHRTDNHTS